MSFLEECRKAEDESKVSKPKSENCRIKTAETTITTDKTAELSRQIKY